MLNKILLVYPGLGKTYAAQNCNNILEIQQSVFKNLNIKDLKNYPEEHKGTKNIAFELNPQYPQNLIDYITTNLPGKLALWH